MEIISLVISSMGLLFIWGAWKRVSLDTCRDSLFDQREAARDYFLETSSLAHPDYKYLRDMLNAHIRFTEDFDFVTILMVLRKVGKEYYRAKKPTYRGENAQFLEENRKMAMQSISVYLVETSLILFSMSWFLLLTKVFTENWSSLKESASRRLLNFVVGSGRANGLERVESLVLTC